MNVFHKLTLESLKKNKTRTIVTIIGIILSTAMICAVASLSSSFHNFLVNGEIANSGAWHVKLEETNKENFEKLQEDKRINKIAYGKEEGYAKVKNADGEETMLFVFSAADGFEDIMPVHITQGRYPVNDNEIIVPEHLSKSRRISYKVGEQVTLDIGKRMYNGNELHQSSIFYYPDHRDEGETFNVIGQKTYTVVGKFKRPTFENYDAIGYTVITKLNSELTQSDTINAYMQLKNPLEAPKLNQEIDKSALNKTLMNLYGVGFGQDSQMTMVIGSILAIILALIFFASVVLIYNAFSISVSERTKQFGLLSSLGATKKQIKKMVNFEALVLSLIGIPIGIICGLVGIAVTLYFIGDKISSTFINEYGVSFDFYVHPIFIVLTIIFALITIFISVRKPSIRATKVSAIDAIRQTNDVKIKKHSIKTPKWVYKVYGLPGMLASKNYKRSSKKYRTTVISLTMSIILFVSASSLTSYMLASLNATGLPDSDIEVFMLTKDSDEIYNAVKNVPSAQGSAHIKVISPQEELHPNIVFVDDENYKELLLQNGLLSKDYIDKSKPKALIYKPSRSNSDKSNYYNVIEDDQIENGKITLHFPQIIKDYDYPFCVKDEQTGEVFVKYYNSNDMSNTKKFKLDEITEKRVIEVGKQIKDPPYYLTGLINDTLVMSIGQFDTVVPLDAYVGESSSNAIESKFEFKAKDYMNCEKEVSEIIHSLDDNMQIDFIYHIQNVTQVLEMTKNVIFIMRVFCYGFVALLTLISCANVFNTITTNIILRRREFAMLQSIGMTDKELHRMMRFECMKYGTTSLFIGIPISILITVIIHYVINQEMEIAFRFPTLAVIICIVSVFLIVFLSMLYSLNKIKSQNTIETLKNENQ